MARCIDCAWFPWKPGADLSGLPAMRCHPDTPMRRWSNAGAETTCEHYQAALAAEEQIVENKPDLEETPDITSGESPTIDEVSEMPEEAPAATETRSGAKGKGKKGGSKQKKGD